MKNIISAFWAVAGMVTIGNAMELQITCSPELPVRNLLKNPSFEEGEGQPAHWDFADRSVYFRWTREYLWISRITKEEGQGRNSGACIRQETNTDSILSELFIRQKVKVKPDTLYRASIRTRIRGGRAYLHLVDSRIEQELAAGMTYKYLISWHNSPLLPEFVREEWLNGPRPHEWHQLKAQLNSKNGDVLYFDFGAYYGKGSADYDDAFLGEALTDMTVKTQEKRDCFIEVKNQEGKIIHQEKPSRQTDELKIFTIKELDTDQRYQITLKGQGLKEKTIWYPAD